MLLVQPIGVLAIGEESGSFAESGRQPIFWVTINGSIEGQVLLDAIEIEHTAEGLTRASLTVINPDLQIEEGMTITVTQEDEDLFAGLIRTVQRDTDQAESVVYYRLEADGWNVLLARRLITSSYANLTTKDALGAMVSDGNYALDGIRLSPQSDDGVTILLANADHVRGSDYMRDIGNAGGGIAYIDDHKVIHFRPFSPMYSPIIVNEAVAENVSRLSDLDNYRNRQFVKVTGLDGTTTVIEERNDTAEQNAKIVLEGGSGIYEDYVEIKHPTSSTLGELSILGQAFAYLSLRTYAHAARRTTVQMRAPAPRIGELVTVSLTAFGISGQYAVMNHKMKDLAGQWIYTLEFWESSFQQLALQSLLNIVGAARATVSISAEIFPNLETFTVVGADTWVVPGGVFAIEITARGPGGGGCGNYDLNNIAGNGGKGGKAVTILAVTPGDTIDTLVGGGGAGGEQGINLPNETGGITAQHGFTGTETKAERAGVLLCRGDSGIGGTRPKAFYRDGFDAYGIHGADGGGFGDAINSGGGHDGGRRSLCKTWPAGGCAVGTASEDGDDGSLEIRW